LVHSPGQAGDAPQGRELLRAAGPVSIGVSFARRQSAVSTASSVAVVAVIFVSPAGCGVLGAAM
jgi:hypothetical protein